MSEFRNFFWMACIFVCAIFTPAHANTNQITLNNGDVLTGEILSETDTAITLEHAVLGQLTIEKTMLMAAAEEAAPTPEVEPDNGLLNTGLLAGWDRRLDLGLSGSAGKSDNHQFNVGFNGNFKSEETRIDFKTAYFRAESEGEVSSHTFQSAINRDWLEPETPWFRFAGAGFDWDEFKDWDYRLNGNAGIGYSFIDNDKWLFLGRTGFGFNQTFGGEREEFTPEGLLAVEARWTISDYQYIKASNTLYPNLKSTTDYRNISTLDWVLDLNTFAGVALKLGLMNEYDAAAEDGIDKNDFRYTAALTWQL